MIRVALLTFKEATKKRILIAALILTAGFLALYATGAHFALRDLKRNISTFPGGDGRAMFTLASAGFLTLGLFVANLVGALLASFLAVGAISSEVEQGTLQSIAVRPLPRRDIILGKWLGYTIIISLYMAILFGALVLVIYSQSGWYPPKFLKAGVVLILETIVVLSVALLGSTFLNAAANGIVVFMLYATALIGGSIEQFGTILGKKILYDIGIVSSLIMPSDNLYRFSVSLVTPKISSQISMAQMGPFGSSATPSLWSLAYAFLFIAAALLIAVRIFSKKDL